MLVFPTHARYLKEGSSKSAIGENAPWKIAPGKLPPVRFFVIFFYF